MGDTTASDFEGAMEELQRMILADAQEYYSSHVIQEWLHPQNVGRMDQPDASAILRGW